MKETYMETTVDYTVTLNGRVYLVENVPARVCVETGESFFAPETVEHIHALIEGKAAPVKTIETPVYSYT